MAGEGFRRGGGIEEASDLDPLFYRGKSPVLGAPVDIRSSGTLPGSFPSAGGSMPGRPSEPVPPGAPNFPNFSFEWSGGEFPAAPMYPGRPNVDILGPGGGKPPWWQSAAGTAETLGSAAGESAKLAKMAGGIGSANYSPFDNSAMDPGMYNIGPDTGINWPGITGGALQTAGGLYGALTGKPGSPGQVASSANAIGGAAGLGAAAGVLPASMAALGPSAALVSLPLLLGPQVAGMIQGDKARWPEGYQFIPGSSKSGGPGAAAVDPSTGAVIVYKGNGHYEFHEGTRAGQVPSADLFKQWEITPTGELAKRTGYGEIGKQLRDVRMSPERATLAAGSGGATPQDVRSAAQDRREPVIARLRAQYPGASEGQLWALYQQTPEWAQEQAERFQQSYQDGR